MHRLTSSTKTVTQEMWEALYAKNCTDVPSGSVRSLPHGIYQFIVTDGKVTIKRLTAEQAKEEVMKHRQGRARGLCEGEDLGT